MSLDDLTKVDLNTVLSLIAAVTGLYVAISTWQASRRASPVIEMRLERIPGRDPWQRVWIVIRNHDPASIRITGLSVRPFRRGRLLPQHLSYANDGFSSEGMAATFDPADSLRRIDLDLQVGPGGQMRGYGTPGATVSFWSAGQNLASAASLRAHWQRSDR